MNKKILIHSLIFSPDSVSTAYLYNDIALRFKREGFEVVVLTTTPHYNIVESELKQQPLKKKFGGLYYESSFHGMKVKHVFQKKHKSTILRLFGFVYWHIVSFFLGIAEKNIDVILSPSPPLTIGLINILIGKIKGAKVVYNVQEIYPDLLIEEGGLKSKVVISFLKWMERFIYNKSDAVTTIDGVFYKTIAGRFRDKSKLHIIPNFVDTDIYHPIDKDKMNLNAELFPEISSLKIMYAGNIGYAQDWETLIGLAEEVRGEPVVFIVIGEGIQKDFLNKEIKKRELTNIRLVSYQPRNLMPSLLAYSDLQFIFMTPLTEKHGFPSKIYTIMACARPIIVSSGEKTPIANFLKDKDCAYLVCENDCKIKKIAEIIRKTSLTEFRQKGDNGLRFIQENYTKEIVTEHYVALINNILK